MRQGAGIVIAVDGPAASGKGTIARALARTYRLAHLDTGLLYRAVGHAILESGGDPHDPETAATAARNLDAAILDDPALRSERVGRAASIVATIPSVREALLAFQRDFAAQPSGDVAGAVLDGRDIGTVICPDADAKLFVTATAEARATRRHAERARMGEAVTRDEVLADIRSRDARDAGRGAAPLAPAEDAHLLDTTDLDIEAAVAEAIRRTDEALRSRGKLAVRRS